MRLNLINFLILASIAVALFARSNAFDEGSCSFTYREDAPVAYFVNLKSERSRRMYMHRTLSRMNLDFHRIPAITPADIYIPPDLNNTWQTDACIFETKWEPSHSSHLRNFDSGFRAPLYVSSLCAKPRFLTEIACTASHLLAIYRACHSTTAKSKYALITEDDIFFAVDIDWQAMINSAPNDFGFLQLFSMHNELTAAHWQDYKRNPQQMWSNETLWTTAAYLVDTVVLRPIIDQLVRNHNDWWQLKMIGPLVGPNDKTNICNPKECCDGDGKPTGKLPCVNSQIAADWWLYKLAPTYTLKAPVSFLGSAVNTSSIQSEDIIVTNPSERGKQYMMEMFNGKVPILPFVKRACVNDLDPPVLNPLLP